MTKISLKIKNGQTISSFSPSDFLEESINDFFESGSDMNKLPICIIKAAIAAELIIKDKLEEICPALILEKIDDDGLQLIKLYNLDSKRSRKKHKNIQLKTASFPVLIKRAENFLPINPHRNALIGLHKIRNELIHHKAELDVFEINVLLTKKIFPFLKEILKQNEISEKTWEHLENIKKEIASVFFSELMKKITHHHQEANSLSKHKIKVLLNSNLELEDKSETINQADLECPSCHYKSMAHVLGLDIDYPLDGGELMNVYQEMRCRVCDLRLDEMEIELLANSDSKKVFCEPNSIDEWKGAVTYEYHDYD